MSALTRSAIDRYIVIRIAGYITLLITYYYTLSATVERVKVQLPLHPELQKRIDFNLRYVTIWNVLFQISYVILALVCDVTSLFHVESIVSKSVRKWRYKYFSGVLFPMSFGIVTFFWAIYSYDRELIYPKISDLIVTKYENLLYHFGVLVYVLWETANFPINSHVKSDSDYKIVFISISSYVVTTLYTGFVDMKSFPYEILNATRGTVWFYVILTGVPLLTLLGYEVQWWFRDWVWRHRGEGNVKIQ